MYYISPLLLDWNMEQNFLDHISNANGSQVHDACMMCHLPDIWTQKKWQYIKQQQNGTNNASICIKLKSYLFVCLSAFLWHTTIFMPTSTCMEAFIVPKIALSSKIHVIFKWRFHLLLFIIYSKLKVRVLTRISLKFLLKTTCKGQLNNFSFSLCSPSYTPIVQHTTGIEIYSGSPCKWVL